MICRRLRSHSLSGRAAFQGFMYSVWARLSRRTGKGKAAIGGKHHVRRYSPTLRSARVLNLLSAHDAMIITPPWLDAKRRVTPRERAPAKLQEGVQLPVGVEQELRESIERKKMTARWAAKDLRLCHADTKGAKTAARVNAEAVALRPSSAVLTQPESLATPQRS
ncbi:unnamed protein product [Durusdinium trenchii]